MECAGVAKVDSELGFGWVNAFQIYLKSKFCQFILKAEKSGE